MEEQQLTPSKPRRFNSKRLKALGMRRDRAHNAAKVLNAIFFDKLPITMVVEKTGLSYMTVHNILKDETTRSEIEQYRNLLTVNALGNINRKIDSSDERVSLQASKFMLDALKDSDKESTIVAPQVDMSALVSHVAGNLLASAMLGIKQQMTDNASYQSLGTNGLQVVTNSMGNEVVVEASPSSPVLLDHSSVDSTSSDD